MRLWRFSIEAGTVWQDGVSAVATEERKRAFWEVAVPRFAAHQGPRPPKPSVVVCHVSAPLNHGKAPGGPAGRAKGLLDALHDDRHSGPKYAGLGLRPPLDDDDPAHVRGLAIEVVAGEPHTEYLLGSGLRVSGELLARIPVVAAAPNDIVGTPSEKASIAAARLAYAGAVRKAFAARGPISEPNPKALIVRHHPQRDEDNTWATWIAGVCGARRGGAGHWAAGAPLSGWAPAAIATLADSSLETPVSYELWG